MLATSLLCLSLLSLGAWIFLVLFRGGFWRARERLDGAPGTLDRWPPVVALVPARNEADVIGACVTRLMRQTYPGPFRVVVIDDHSTDGTAAEAEKAASAEAGADKLTLVRSRALEPGWAGKVWALSEGHAYARQAFPDTRYFWLTDADIAHDPLNLRRLVAKAERGGAEAGGLDLVSQMVLLTAEGFWAGILIPAFVFFFQKLYPFAWVNDPRRRTAAAAGGSVLLRRDALERIGGFAALHDARIDDCALARAVKRDKGGAGGGQIWLGLTTAAESLRPYHGLAGIWHMVARSAFTQLGYSSLLLAGTLAGMALLYWGVPVMAVAALLTGQVAALLCALGAWTLMTLAFMPILRLYRRPLLAAPSLPLAGLMYSLMTLASAVAYWRGRGGAWKGRTLSAEDRRESAAAGDLKD